MKGLFISFEGGDGAGKTTQIMKLKNYYEQQGRKVVLTREPGGTRIAETIRELILNPEFKEMDFMTEALLYAASRAQHVKQIILPALMEGKVVLCDRFVDSSVVYQGIGRSLGVDTVEKINSYATLGLMPQVTLLIDLPVEEGIKRKKKQQTLDRLEAEKQGFHEQVRKGYLDLANRHPDRIEIVDGMKKPEEIWEAICTILKSKELL